MLDERRLRDLAEHLVGVPGVRAVALGGSRARGDHTAESDVDLGLYYRAPLDVEAVAEVARAVAGPDAWVTAAGEWGPWVDGGGWLRIDQTAVDWIYRDLDRVQRSWRDGQAGRFSWHFQVGHPLGVPDFAYAAEAALAVVLADPSGELTELQQEARQYPPRLREALIAVESGRPASASTLPGRQCPGLTAPTFPAVCSGRSCCAPTLCTLTPVDGWSTRRAQ